MVTLMMRYRVADEARYASVFREFGEVRRAHGATGHRRLRVAGAPDDVVVLVDFPTAEAARAFLADPARPPALERAGIDPASEQRTLLEEVEAVAY